MSPKITCLRSLLLALFLALGAPVHAADTGLEFQDNDAVPVVLARQGGKVVELRLKSGEKIGGKVEKVGAKLVHLSQITGAEFFEAVVLLDDISAVVVRAKSK
ncbi:MAG: hypothetical protein QOE70_1047 [Chthoniobacter sp.]|jgi:hypothetical protein|nr:hypothetical protein [Chthoniobacter sp.]